MAAIWIALTAYLCSVPVQIKSYPRTVSATSVRKVDDGRIQKRKAREERKKTVRAAV